MKKWQKEYLEWLKTAQNEEIFDEFVSCSVGDDWDGMQTTACKWKLIKVKKELNERLFKCGFLTEL